MGIPRMRVSNKLKVLLGLLLVSVAVAAIAWYLQGKNVAVLSPAGTVADKQRDLMVFATILSLVVILPVFVLTFFIVWRYRDSNTKSKYTPDWDHSRRLETIWWGIPCVIILVLAVVTWTSSHELDPFKPIASTKAPVTIQVVAMQWKWLFIYPEQGIATVNYVQFPKDTPINFEITSDAPMNSFWIPQLGGQIYAMAGMSTQLHLMATETGTFQGSSANLSGAGFANMKFVAVSSSQADFDSWVGKVKHVPNVLTAKTYTELAKPSENNPPAYYATATSGLYDTVMMKFMMPGTSMDESNSDTTTNMQMMHH